MKGGCKRINGLHMVAPESELHISLPHPHACQLSIQSFQLFVSQLHLQSVCSTHGQPQLRTNFCPSPSWPWTWSSLYHCCRFWQLFLLSVLHPSLLCHPLLQVLTASSDSYFCYQYFIQVSCIQPLNHLKTSTESPLCPCLSKESQWSFVGRSMFISVCSPCIILAILLWTDERESMSLSFL